MIRMPQFSDRPSISLYERVEAKVVEPAPPPPSTPETGDTAKQADTLLTRNLATLQ